MNKLAVSISKVDALLEMVKAHDENDINKSNKIGRLLCKSMQTDYNKKIYSKYIELNRNSKLLFPANLKKTGRDSKIISDSIYISMKTTTYAVKIEDDIKIIPIKLNED